MIGGEWISWAPCPRCGQRAAVGWTRASRLVRPVEFDCAAGCHFTAAESAKAFPPAGLAGDEQSVCEDTFAADMGEASRVAAEAAKAGAAAVTIAVAAGGEIRVSVVRSPQHRPRSA